MRIDAVVCPGQGAQKPGSAPTSSKPQYSAAFKASSFPAVEARLRKNSMARE